jgi:ABC-2 type transport system ATP-binding protein
MVQSDEPEIAADVGPTATEAARPLVRVRGMGRDYGGVVALESLDIEVSAGEAVALVGQNGSGKTTALSLIAGRLEPTRGTVRVDGIDVHQRGGSDTVRSLVSFIPDAPALYADLTVADHLQLVGMAYGVEELDERSDLLLERFGLETRQHLLPRELSRGMRQKTQLACALLRPFAVLLLDEPIAGLDPSSRQALSVLLADAKQEGAVVMFSTHQLDFAQGLVDRVLVLEDGRVVAVGPYDRVVRHERAKEWGLA